MKKVVGRIFSVLVILSCLAGCDVYTPDVDYSSRPEEASVSLTEEYVIECLQNTPNVTNVAAVTEDNDPNNRLNSGEGMYYAAVYFATDYLEYKDLKGEELIDKGTDAGGCVELYDTEEYAEIRNSYLSLYDNSIFLKSGYHTVLGRVVIRTSQHLTEEQQKTLESNIMDSLRNGGIDESAFYDGEKQEDIDVSVDEEVINDDENKKIIVTMSEGELKNLTTSDAEKKLRDMGFTVFEYDTLSAGDRSDLDGKIGAVEIKSWQFGNGDFAKGDTYDSDAIVVLWSYKYTEPSKPRPVFYSTNDYETAKKGNTGVFSYKSMGGTYDVYWIIDFNDGYVYFFTDGNGDNTCDKVKIVSGDLNDKIVATWHDGEDQWTWYLHFKYENHPETLVVNDHNGFATEFKTTDLDDALNVRNTKIIKNY